MLTVFYLWFFVVAPLITGIILYRAIRFFVRKNLEKEGRRGSFLYNPLLVALVIPATFALHVIAYLNGRKGRRLSLDKPEDMDKLLQSVKFEALYSYAYLIALLLALVCAAFLSFSSDRKVVEKWTEYGLRFRLWLMIWTLAFLWYAILEALCGQYMCYI